MVSRLPLKGSVSKLPNNLSLLARKDGKEIHLAYVSGSSVYVTTVEFGKGGSKHDLVSATVSGTGNNCCQVTQAEWCNLKCKDYLVVLTTTSIEVHDDAGALLFKHTPEQIPNPTEISYFRGVCALSNCLVVGDSQGNVTALMCDKKKAFVLGKPLPVAHKAPICSITSNGAGMFATSDELGGIQLWDAENLDLLTAFEAGDPEQGPVFGLCFIPEYLVAGSYNGTITLYSLLAHVAAIEIRAHSREVSCISAIPGSSMFASIGDDSVVQIWKLTDTVPQSAEQAWHSTISFCPCGVAAINRDLILTGYDSASAFALTDVIPL